MYCLHAGAARLRPPRIDCLPQPQQQLQQLRRRRAQMANIWRSYQSRRRAGYRSRQRSGGGGGVPSRLIRPANRRTSAVHRRDLPHCSLHRFELRPVPQPGRKLGRVKRRKTFYRRQLRTLTANVYTKTCKRLLNVYMNMAAGNKTQMVLSHVNSIVVSNAACEVNSAAFR